MPASPWRTVTIRPPVRRASSPSGPSYGSGRGARSGTSTTLATRASLIAIEPMREAAWAPSRPSGKTESVMTTMSVESLEPRATPPRGVEAVGPALLRSAAAWSSASPRSEPFSVPPSLSALASPFSRPLRSALSRAEMGRACRANTIAPVCAAGVAASSSASATDRAAAIPVVPRLRDVSMMKRTRSYAVGRVSVDDGEMTVSA